MRTAQQILAAAQEGGWWHRLDTGDRISLFSAVGTILAALVAIGAAIVAFKQVRAARDAADSARSQADSAKIQADAAQQQTAIAREQTELQRQLAIEAAQPYVWADFRQDNAQGMLVYLVVRNQGPTVARDVRVVFEPGLTPFGLQDHYTLSPVQEMLANGLDALPPGREMKWTMCDGHKINQAPPNAELRYNVTIDAVGPDQRPIPTLRYVLDLTEFGMVRDETLGSLERIKSAIDELTKATKGVT